MLIGFMEIYMFRFVLTVFLSLIAVACSDDIQRPPEEEILKLINLHLQAEGYLEIVDLDHVASENKGSETAPLIHSRYEFAVETLEDFVSHVSDIRKKSKPYDVVKVIKPFHSKGTELKGEVIVQSKPYLQSWTINVDKVDLETTGIPFSNYERNGWKYIFEDDPKLPELVAKYQRS